MRAASSRAAISAIELDDRNVCEPNASDNSVCEDGAWFVRAAQHLLAPKPGFILDLETECGERNGDRYASGAVKVPSSVVRRLLHSQHGESWLNALMDGCAAPWWRDLKRDAEFGRQVRDIAK